MYVPSIIFHRTGEYIRLRIYDSGWYSGGFLCGHKACPGIRTGSGYRSQHRLVGAICGFIGAKILFCIVEYESFLADPLGTFISGNGFVVYGGIIGGVAGAYLYCKKKGHDFLRYFDLIMPSIALAQGFGRIGCFLAGCCYGMETDLPVGVVFTHSELAPNGVKLLPTQLMSSAGDFLIAIVLIILAKKITEKGKIGILYVILYSVGRFTVEFFRNDARGSIGALSTSQFISIFTFVAGVIIYIWISKRNKKESEE